MRAREPLVSVFLKVAKRFFHTRISKKGFSPMSYVVRRNLKVVNRARPSSRFRLADRRPQADQPRFSQGGCVFPDAPPFLLGYGFPAGRRNDAHALASRPDHNVPAGDRY